MPTLNYYIDLLSHMSVNKNKSKPAPHKAVLLLTIIDMIEVGEISSPFVQISDSLIENFRKVWNSYVPRHSGYVQKITYPFIHLSSSPFWKLVKASSYQGQTEYSGIKALKRDYSGAMIDAELFQMLKDPFSRKEIRELLKYIYLGERGTSSSLIGITTIIALICTVA